MEKSAEKINLNASDDEDDVQFEDFRIRPQFQGRHGQELLELSSKLPERFKLDERFAEVFETEDFQEAETTDEINEEKKKNIRILESILGHEVGTKSTEKNRKRQIRFDPEDESTSHLVKDTKTAEKLKKSKKKKKVEEKAEQTLPVSTERYVEVCSNLKEVLNTATPFSFSQQFNQDIEEVGNSLKTYEFYPEKYIEQSEEIETPELKTKKEYQNQKYTEELSSKQTFPKSKSSVFLFFVKEGDPRLKEGIEFFKRPKPLDEIRVEWQKKRERVLELFRRKKRSSQRSYSTRVQTVQNKFSIRRQNFKK